MDTVWTFTSSNLMEQFQNTSANQAIELTICKYEGLKKYSTRSNGKAVGSLKTNVP